MIGPEQRYSFGRLKAPMKGGAIGGYPLGAVRPFVDSPRTRLLRSVPRINNQFPSESADASHINLFTVDNVRGQAGLRELESKVDTMMGRTPGGRPLRVRARGWRIYRVERAGEPDKYLVAVFPLSTYTSTRSSRLTERNRDVIFQAAHGVSHKEIAKRLNISEDTVKNHCTNIHETLGVTSLTEAVVLTFNEGVLDADDEELKKIPVEELDELTNPMRNILEIIAGNNSCNKSISLDKDIAIERRRSVYTVGRQLRDIYDRTGARNRPQLAFWYLLYKTRRYRILRLREQ